MIKQRKTPLSLALLSVMSVMVSPLTYAQVVAPTAPAKPAASSAPSTPASSANNSGLSKSATGAETPRSSLKVDQTYYISTDGLNIRSSNSTTSSNVVGKLSLNDQVQIVDLLNEATPLVQIKIIKSASVKPDVAPELYVSKDYLSEKEVGAPTQGSSKYFVIQNIATEKTRVYERCTDTPDCPHKLILETDMVVGRPEGPSKNPNEFLTWLGHARIAEWVKFYQDGAGHYPRWYSTGQAFDTIPSPISDSPTKLLGARKWLITYEGKPSIYGAFGWFAAILTPSDSDNGVNAQWMHGTMGWGVDGNVSIELTRSFIMNLVSDPGSSGCTRLENQAIAYLRQNLPIGTDIYRIYARESTREQEITTGIFHKSTTPFPRYADVYNNPGSWDWILTTVGAEKSGGLTADAAVVKASGIPLQDGVNVLERGTYHFNRYPHVLVPNYMNLPSSGVSGDRYHIDSGRENTGTNFKGYFLIDEGRLVDYEHPSYAATNGKIKVSGLPDFRTSVPDYLKTSGAHHPPAIIYQRDPNNDHERN